MCEECHDVIEEDFPHHNFYKKLKNNDSFDPEPYKVHTYSVIPISDKGYLKLFGAQLIRNYRDILPSFGELNYKTRCRYLNYWVREETDRYEREKSVSGFENYIRTFISQVWNKLDNEVRYKCEMEGFQFPINDIRIRKELDDFCTSREILHTKSENDYSCIAVNDWINRNYNKYFSKENCKTYNKINNGYNEEFGPFHISKSCTFYDIPTTFRTFVCGSYVPEYKIKSILNCERNTSSDNLENLPVIGQPDNKLNVPTWTTVLVVSLTFFGILFALFILYKFSPFGSFLRHNVLEKYNVQEYMDDNIKPFLESTLHTVYETSDKRRHTIGYHATQNNMLIHNM
ncbi:PIR Superfamily Protein [Plasmodium ovale wallikeri]|uniref:PIR Superfamily Protein n=1 Tax=Plasmodium ovale wallikeri TaxID=864142 RepID=A0A1A9APD5_PLAOA|nr:PIR Superfamily Protein [Plasmodium ovale wallikeri]